MNRKLIDHSRYFGILLLTVILFLGTVVTGFALWPNLTPLWVTLLLAGCTLMFPFAVWLDRKLR